MPLAANVSNRWFRRSPNGLRVTELKKIEILISQGALRRIFAGALAFPVQPQHYRLICAFVALASLLPSMPASA
jgi:hypothetical protein